MPSSIVTSFAKKTGKSEKEVERLWHRAKAAAKKSYPEMSTDDEKYYAIVTSILKSMVGLKESFLTLADNELKKLTMKKDPTDI